MTNLRLVAALVMAASVLSACGGGSHSAGSVPALGASPVSAGPDLSAAAPHNAGPAPGAVAANVSVSIPLPLQPSSTKRAPRYLTSYTKGLDLQAYQNGTYSGYVFYPLSALQSYCSVTGSTYSCNLSVQAPVGSGQIIVHTYDNTTVATSNMLSVATQNVTIAPNQANTIAIATLAIGEIISLIILNWETVTRGPIGISGIPPLSLFGHELVDTPQIYWFTLLVMVVLALLQMRLLGSHLGRGFRAIRDDDVAARAYGLSLNRYKALAFIFGGFAAGVSGGIAAHLYSYINHETFNTQQSILALTIVILGGLGNVAGAIVGSVALVGLPEVFRIAAEYRILIYGIVLLLLVRFRPQGLLGTI